MKKLLTILWSLLANLRKISDQGHAVNAVDPMSSNDANFILARSRVEFDESVAGVTLNELSKFIPRGIIPGSKDPLQIPVSQISYVDEVASVVRAYKSSHLDGEDLTIEVLPDQANNVDEAFFSHIVRTLAAAVTWVDGYDTSFMLILPPGVSPISGETLRVWCRTTYFEDEIPVHTKVKIKEDRANELKAKQVFERGRWAVNRMSALGADDIDRVYIDLFPIASGFTLPKKEKAVDGQVIYDVYRDSFSGGQPSVVFTLKDTQSVAPVLPKFLILKATHINESDLKKFGDDGDPSRQVHFIPTPAAGDTYSLVLNMSSVLVSRGQLIPGKTWSTFERGAERYFVIYDSGLTNKQIKDLLSALSSKTLDRDTIPSKWPCVVSVYNFYDYGYHSNFGEGGNWHIVADELSEVEKLKEKVVETIKATESLLAGKLGDVKSRIDESTQQIKEHVTSEGSGVGQKVDAAASAIKGNIDTAKDKVVKVVEDSRTQTITAVNSLKGALTTSNQFSFDAISEASKPVAWTDVESSQRGMPSEKRLAVREYSLADLLKGYGSEVNRAFITEKDPKDWILALVDNLTEPAAAQSVYLLASSKKRDPRAEVLKVYKNSSPSSTALNRLDWVSKNMIQGTQKLIGTVVTRDDRQIFIPEAVSTDQTQNVYLGAERDRYIVFTMAGSSLALKLQVIGYLGTKDMALSYRLSLQDKSEMQSDYSRYAADYTFLKKFGVFLGDEITTSTALDSGETLFSRINAISAGTAVLFDYYTNDRIILPVSLLASKLLDSCSREVFKKTIVDQGFKVGKQFSYASVSYKEDAQADSLCLSCYIDTWAKGIQANMVTS